MALVGKGKTKVRESGFVVTRDVDSRDRSAADRLWAFLFGRSVRVGGQEYSCPLVRLLASIGVDHEVDTNVFP